MVELEVLKWAVIGLLSLTTYLLKRTVDGMDKDIEKLQGDITNIKNEYLHKNDFKDFKTELRAMFDELKSDIRDRLGAK